MKCVKCGAVLEDGAGFCSECGTKVEVVPEAEASAVQQESPKFCVNCGKEYMEGAAFCVWCGAPRNGNDAKSQSASFVQHESASYQQTQRQQKQDQQTETGNAEKSNVTGGFAQKTVTADNNAMQIVLKVVLTVLAVQLVIGGFKDGFDIFKAVWFTLSRGIRHWGFLFMWATFRRIVMDALFCITNICFAGMLGTLAYKRNKENSQTLFCGVLAAAGVYIGLCIVDMPMFLFRNWASNCKLVVYGAAVAGITCLLLMVVGENPIENFSLERMKEAIKELSKTLSEIYKKK